MDRDRVSEITYDLIIFRSRLAGQQPKEVSNKLNFKSFMDHYEKYPVAQALYNKMVRLIWTYLTCTYF